MVCPFKYILLSGTFEWCYLLLSISQIEIWVFLGNLLEIPRELCCLASQLLFSVSLNLYLSQLIVGKPYQMTVLHTSTVKPGYWRRQW